jgi:hypothetical protein
MEHARMGAANPTARMILEGGVREQSREFVRREARLKLGAGAAGGGLLALAVPPIAAPMAAVATGCSMLKGAETVYNKVRQTRQGKGRAEGAHGLLAMAMRGKPPPAYIFIPTVGDTFGPVGLGGIRCGQGVVKAA